LGRAHVFVSNFPGYVSAKHYRNRMKPDKDITKKQRMTFLRLCKCVHDIA